MFHAYVLKNTRFFRVLAMPLNDRKSVRQKMIAFRCGRRAKKWASGKLEVGCTVQEESSGGASHWHVGMQIRPKHKQNQCFYILIDQKCKKTQCFSLLLQAKNSGTEILANQPTPRLQDLRSQDLLMPISSCHFCLHFAADV